jgi:hypothetical protein
MLAREDRPTMGMGEGRGEYDGQSSDVEFDRTQLATGPRLHYA